MVVLRVHADGGDPHGTTLHEPDRDDQSAAVDLAGDPLSPAVEGLQRGVWLHPLLESES